MKEIIKEIGENILFNNIQREKNTLSKFACFSESGLRLYPEREKIPDGINIRSSFFHDTDKIIHSLAYTRYIDKTQVFFLFNNDHITHRVLHVQFVAKIARVIGRCLRLNEDLIEAISLGHDIGHVPYGHDGECFLNELCINNGVGYFCHNAHSVRSLMLLENRGKGLNLTLQVLDGILCHNGEFLKKIYEPEKEKTWDRFLEEYNNCREIENFDKTLKPMTLEGCVVRISDVIAYIGRDIEDAISVNLIKREDIPGEIAGILGDSNSEIINSLAVDLINNSMDKSYLQFSDEIFGALKLLLDFNYKYIYHNFAKRTQIDKIRNMFNTLFELCLEDIRKGRTDSRIFKDYIYLMDDEYAADNKSERIVADYIAGMTDDYFNREFKARLIPESYGVRLT
jgi:dGTPase